MNCLKRPRERSRNTCCAAAKRQSQRNSPFARHAVLICVVLLAGCAQPEPPLAAPTVPTAPPAVVPPTPVPVMAQDTATTFFNAWQQSQYSAMYDVLSSSAQAAT